ncbi:MAG: hypothetical protein ACM3QS_15770 [Bacteroidota bacterium]
MNYLVILLRLLHVLGGVFWVGTVLALGLFVGPAAAANPQAGQAMMQYLVGKARISTWISAAAGVTMLAGAILYWLDSDGFRSAWTTSGPGIGFALGAIAAAIGMALGVQVGRANKSLGSLATQIKGQPSAEQAAELAALRAKLARLTPPNVIFLVLAAVLMAVARYLNF